MIKLKIAISSTGQGLDSQLSPVFGRCPYFIFVEIDSKKIKNENSVGNPSMAQVGGAGIATAQLVANEKVDAVISGAVGPRAFALLQQLGIKIFAGVAKTVKENVDLLIENKLKEISVPISMGFGMGTGFGRSSGVGGGFGAGRRRGKR